MGMRIHKNMGYGLRNLKSFLKPGLDGIEWDTRDVKILDIKDELVKSWSNNEDKDSWSHTLKFYLNREGEKYIHKHLYDYVSYQDEFGNKDFVQFTPILFSEGWQRYDDYMDHAEWSIKYLKRKNHPNWSIVDCPGPLYPFISLMKGDSLETFESYWESCYLDRPEAETKIPFVPFEIYHTMRIMDVFTDPFKAFMSLRPTIYTYWS